MKCKFARILKYTIEKYQRVRNAKFLPAPPSEREWATS